MFSKLFTTSTYSSRSTGNLYRINMERDTLRLALKRQRTKDNTEELNNP
jgi:hypothetical protein